MQITTATQTTNELGPLCRRVFEWTKLIEELTATVHQANVDWAPYAEFIAVDTFKRVGAYEEVMGWQQYTAFLEEWAGSTRFQATILRVTEIGNLVFQEIIEHHDRQGKILTKNVIALFVFDKNQKIVHLDIYEQAKDSGDWIKSAAQRTQ